MSDSEAEIVEIKENGEPLFDSVKPKMVRNSARFIRDALKNYKNQMTDEYWKQLVVLAKFLEQNWTPAEFVDKFNGKNMRNIELVIANLKTKIETLWNSNHVIVIDDDEPNNEQAEEQSSESTPHSTPRSSPVYLDLTSSPPAEGKDSVSTSINARQQDNVRIVNNTSLDLTSFHEARKKLVELYKTAFPQKPDESQVGQQSPPSPIPCFNANNPWPRSMGNCSNNSVMNNNNSQNYNYNCQDFRGCNVNGCCNKSQKESFMSNRFNLRDPRLSNLGNNNRPPIAADCQQQHQLQQPSVNNDYCYVINNFSHNDNNNNQMIWNGIRHPINPVSSQYPNFGNSQNRREPRTYGEYRLAKQRRQLEEAERQRQLEAAEKQRQIHDCNKAVMSIDRDHHKHIATEKESIVFKTSVDSSDTLSSVIAQNPEVELSEVEAEDSEQESSRNSLNLQETEPEPAAATAQDASEVALELATTTKVSVPIQRERVKPHKKKQSVKRNRGRPVLLKKQPPSTSAPVKRKKGRPLKKQPSAQQTDNSASQEDLGNIEIDDSEDLDLALPTTSLSAISSVFTNPAIEIPFASSPPKRKVRRNEADKLMDDIAEMYYGADVLRVTGRRPCTTQKRKLFTFEPDSSCWRSRRNRASFKVKQKKIKAKKSTKRCVVRLTPIDELNKNLKIENQVMELKQEPDNEEVCTNSLILPETSESQLVRFIDSIGTPPALPEEDQLLVINECELEQKEDGGKLEEILQQDTPIEVSELHFKSEPELDIPSTPSDLDPPILDLRELNLDWNAPGVGEILSAQRTPPVINQTSELGLAINGVFSLADGTITSLNP